MTMAEAVTKRLDNLLFSKSWSLYKLAKEANLPLSTLKNLYCGHTKSPTLSVIFKISNAFEMSVIEFLSDEIFNSEELELE